MKITNLTSNFIIISIYLLTLFCGVGTIIQNNILDSVRTILQFILPFLIVLLILKDNIKELKNIKKYKVPYILITLNIIWFIISIIFGISIGMQSVKGLFTFTNILLLLFLISNIHLSSEQSLKIKKSIFISCFICALYGLIQYIFKINLNIFENAKYPGINGRINSTFFIATLLDKYMVLMLAITSYSILKNKSIFLKILFLLVGLNVILTFSRGGLIALILIVFVFILKSILLKKYNNLLLPIVLFIIAFLIPGVNYLFQLTANYGYEKLNIPEFLRINFVVQSNNVEEEDKPVDVEDDTSLNFRDYYNSVGLELMKENMISGIGLNNYSYLYNNQNAKDYLENDKVIQKDLKYMYPHSGFIQLGSEIGIVGLLLFLAYLIYICFKFLSLSFSKYKYLPLILFVVFLLGNYTESLIFNKQYMSLFVILFGLCSNDSFYYTKIKNSKKHIKFLLLHLGKGGIETATVNTANTLSNKYDITLVSLYRQENDISNLVNKNVSIKYLLNYSSNRNEFLMAIKSKKILNILTEGFKSLKILYLKKKLIIDEILSSEEDILISTRMEFSILLSKYGKEETFKIACEHQHHNHNVKYIDNIKNKYNNLNVLVGLTDSLCEDYKNFLKNNKNIKIVKIPNMLLNDEVKISSGKNKRIVSVGRLHKGKKIDEAIEIYSELGSDYVFDIAGNGDEYNNLCDQIKKLNLSKKVNLLGNLDKNEVNKLLSKSDIFVMTSVSEGLPMVLIEAMRCGVVCIAYETESGVNDIIKNNKNGYVIKDRNKKEFIKKLQELMDNSKKLESMQKEAIKTSKEFMEENVSKLWINLIEEF